MIEQRVKDLANLRKLTESLPEEIGDEPVFPLPKQFKKSNIEAELKPIGDKIFFVEYKTKMKDRLKFNIRDWRWYSYVVRGSVAVNVKKVSKKVEFACSENAHAFLFIFGEVKGFKL